MRARRLDIVDQVVHEDESVVMVGHTVVRLSALATALLAELDEWVEAEALADAMAGVLGPPPEGVDPVGTIETALRDMAELGLVEHD